MPHGSRPERVAEQIRQILSEALTFSAHDPGIGLVTLTRVTVSADLQVARVSYTTMGDEAARKETRKALERATPFLRRQVGRELRLRRVPELHFHFDASIENQERIERILLDLQHEREAREADQPVSAPQAPADGDQAPGAANQGPRVQDPRPDGEETDE